jgi:hypothetical protein
MPYTPADRELFWHATIHVVFVVSSFWLALSDRNAGYNAPEPASGTHAARAAQIQPAGAP